MTEKYPIDAAPQLVIPIRHKQKYSIIDTCEVPVRIPVKDYKRLRNYFDNKGFGNNLISAHFILRSIFAKQVKDYITKQYPEAKFANIICHMMTTKKSGKNYYDFTISVDVLS